MKNIIENMAHLCKGVKILVSIFITCAMVVLSHNITGYEIVIRSSEDFVTSQTWVYDDDFDQVGYLRDGFSRVGDRRMV